MFVKPHPTSYPRAQPPFPLLIPFHLITHVGYPTSPFPLLFSFFYFFLSVTLFLSGISSSLAATHLLPAQLEPHQANETTLIVLMLYRPRASLSPSHPLTLHL
eukprot:TRINITY_DN38162_c0_g1_i1.p1 TRINITY_DN38162_c0_g1~~TRINITY_DN38162_c0_g1_i1.p1  ORF type:complete len:103 (+),score=11.11 TRINITY_DN38162_c0_g1_i1:118-426(+)